MSNNAQTYLAKFMDTKDFIDVPDDTYVFAFGDVHGCHEELEEMCHKMTKYASEHGKAAQIWSLGDVIDRGPGLLEVFDVISDYNVRLIRGNHELNFLLECYGHKHCRSKERRKTHEAFNALNVDDQEFILDYIKASRNYAWFEINDTPFLISHAPVKEGVVNNNNLTSWTFCSRNTPYGEEITKNSVCIHGHQHWNYSPIDQESIKDRAWLNLDGGVVYGDALVGVCLNTLDLFEVEAKKTYCKN